VWFVSVEHFVLVSAEATGPERGGKKWVVVVMTYVFWGFLTCMDGVMQARITQDCLILHFKWVISA
jgi:hypothetical protein